MTHRRPVRGPLDAQEGKRPAACCFWCCVLPPRVAILRAQRRTRREAERGKRLRLNLRSEGIYAAFTGFADGWRFYAEDRTRPGARDAAFGFAGRCHGRGAERVYESRGPGDGVFFAGQVPISDGDDAAVRYLAFAECGLQGVPAPVCPVRNGVAGDLQYVVDCRCDSDGGVGGLLDEYGGRAHVLRVSGEPVAGGAV